MKGEVDLVLAHRQVDDGSLEYLIKWKDTAHLHNTWEPEARVEHISKMKMRNYQAKKINKTDSDDDVSRPPIQKLSDLDMEEDENVFRQEWTRIDRILDKRKVNGEAQYLVKWEGLPYDQLTWESEELVKKFPDKLQQYKTIHVDSQKSKDKQANQQNGNNNNNFQEFKTQPAWLTHPLFDWQLDGLN